MKSCHQNILSIKWIQSLNVERSMRKCYFYMKKICLLEKKVWKGEEKNSAQE